MFDAPQALLSTLFSSAEFTDLNPVYDHARVGDDLLARAGNVAAVQAMEAILARHAAGSPNCLVEVDHAKGGLVLLAPGKAEMEVPYEGRVNEEAA